MSLHIQRTEEKSLVVSTLADSKRVPSKPKINVLDEDSYIDNLEKIIVKDFYPDLPKLQAQADYLDAVQRNDIEKLREIQIKYGPKRGSNTTPSIYGTPATFETPEVKPKDTPREKAGNPGAGSDTPAKSSGTEGKNDGTEHDTQTPEANTKSKKDPSKVSLDKFLSNHTSEDNASFEDLMQEAQKKHEHKHAWLFEEQAYQESEKEKRLALPGIEQQAIECGSSKVQTWTYVPKNAVMYVPEGVEKTVAEKMETPGYSREIVHTNTRFKVNPFDLSKNKEQLSEAASAQAQNLHGKIGPDGKEILPVDTPKVNGYGFMATPSPAPGVQDSPLMTWGEIEGTPFHLDGRDTPLLHSGGQGPIFKIPNVPRRDKLGMALAEKASKSHRMKKQEALKRVTANFSTPSPKFGAASKSERLLNLSPAAQKLANAKLKIRTNTDKALRASYTPSPTHRLPGDKTPVSLTPGSSRSTPKNTPGRRTPSGKTPKRDGAEIASLTDNLLNLPKRSKAFDYF